MASVKQNVCVKQYISDVLPGSPAERAGVVRGDALVAIDGEPVCDVVDYEFLSANGRVTLSLENDKGEARELVIEKEDYEPLGLRFATGLMSDMRSCKNRCLFCFIDQMPKGVRTSLHVKDDDWRMSFIMGNYVSLTNVDDAEFERMVKRRVSPLYISLHASDPDVRIRMMKNSEAGRVMERLRRLSGEGLRFHLQIVLCPGLNDGAVLEKSLDDAVALMPAAQSLAIVPVGLTKYREGLAPLSANTREDAQRLIRALLPRQKDWLGRFGTRFAFLSDEWYILADEPLPPYEDYEDFPQIENGVGLLRLFEHDFCEALADKRPLRKPRRLAMAGGESACAFFQWMPETLEPYGVELTILPVHNDYFGGGVNVGGLVTGGDLTAQLSGQLNTDALLIPRAMLRENDDVFLDGITLSEAERALHTKIYPVADGGDMAELLLRRKL